MPLGNRLQNDLCRCYGVGCTIKHQCKRFLTIPLDVEYDTSNGIRPRSYATTLLDITGNRTDGCEDYIGEDK